MGQGRAKTFDEMLATAYQAVGINPEQQAQINQMARTANIPAAVFKHTGTDTRNLLEARQLIERVQNSPRVRQSLSDPSRLGVAQDDIDNLIKLEENTNRYGGMMRVENSWLKDLTESVQRGFKSGVANSILVEGTEGGIMRGLQEQRAAAAKANGVYYNPHTDTAVAYLNQRRKADAHAPDWSAQQDAAQFAQINRSGSFWDATKFAFTHPWFVANTAAESVGSQAPVLAETAAVGGIHPLVMAATVGMGSYRSEYASSLSETIQEHADQLQGMSQVEALTYALGRQDWMAEARNKAARRGMAVGAFDAVNAGFAGKLLNIARGGGAARTALAVGGEGALQVGGGMGGEATAQALTGEYKPGDIVMEGFAEFATGPTEILGNTREARAMAREARAEAAAQAQAEIDQAAQQSKLAQRDPVTFGEVVDDVVGNQHHLYLDAQALNQSGLAEAAAKASPSIAAQYAQALQQGGDIQVPQNEWVSLISPNKELADPLRQIARFEPDGVSLAEAAEQKAAAQAEGQQELEAQARQQERAAQQQAQAERQAVEQEVVDQLEQVGQFDRKANQNYAALVSSYVATQAQRLGIPIPEMWQAHKLNIVGDIGNAPALNQALASAPPKGWVHTETDMEFRNLWNGTSKAQAAFLTDPHPKLENDFPELTGFSLSFDRSAVHHIRNQHGNSETEIARGQIAISEEDVARIGDIVQDYDDVRFRDIPGTNNKRFVFVKSFDDGVLLYMAESSKKRRDLRTVSLWKFPPTANAHNKLEHAASLLNLTPVAGGGISHTGNSTLDPKANQGPLYQSAEPTAEMLQFEETAQKYGGEEAYEQAKADGKTELTYRQWVQVRTPAFKQWFGDWENDPANASKVVNEKTGEPLVVYHGTTAVDKILDDGFKSNTGKLWVHLTDSKEVADSYQQWKRGNSAGTLELFVRSMHPAVFDAQGNKYSEIGNKVFGATYDAQRGDNDSILIKDIRDNFDSSVPTEPHLTVVVFNSNQIKSATDNSGAFDAGNDSILHQAARGAFMPGSNTIALLENADLSTTIHELGHYFLHTGLNIANALEAKAARGEELSVGERQHLTDMQATLNWLGLADLQAWNALNFEQQRPYHEQLARGFEAYVMEGKAPSLEMRSIFQRMKAWMLRVYQNLTQLDVQLSDEVRGVFDRLLASDEEIALAEQNRSMALLFDDPEVAGMSAEEFADYQALGQAATAEAQEQLSAKAVRDMQYGRNARTKHLRALQREAKTARIEAETEVRREVMRQPVYQAWQKLTAKLTDADKIGRAETPRFSPQVDETHDSLFAAIAKLGGLNKDELVHEWGFDRQDKVAAVAAGYPVLRRKNGLGIDEMAERLAQYGYLPLDSNGKWDIRDLEERFFDEHRGERQYSTAFVPREEAKAGEQVANPFAVYAVRFDDGSLRELGLNDSEIQLLRERKMVNSAHGWHPDLIAEMVLDEDGNPYFGSGEELARAIVQAPPPQQVVESLADDLMLQRHGELATPEAIAEAADEAAHNEVRLRVLTREYNALAKAVGNRTLLAAAAKEAAQRTIGRLQLKDVSPTRYRRMAAKAARQAEAALKRGDTAAAAAEKRNQILQTALAQAATEARQQSDKIRSQWQKWANKPRQKSAKTHDAALTEVVRAVVGLYGIAPRKGLAAAEYLETASQYQGENQEAVRQAWERALGDVKRNGDHKQFNELSRDELQAIHDQLAGLREQAKREHQVRIDGKLQDREQTAEVLREELRAAKPNAKGVTTDQAVGELERSRWNLRSLVYSATRVESWSEAMGQGFLNYIYRPIKQGAEAYRKQTNEFKQGFKALLEPIQQDFDRPKIHSPELNYTFTFNELLHAMLHSGNESNLRKLLIGRGWGEDTPDGLNTARWEAFINRMQEEGVIQERHWQFAQGVWDLLEQSKPKAQQAHFEVFGYYFDEIAANPIQTPWGEFRGGYVPAQIDADLVVDGQMRELANQENENMDYAFPTTAKGFTKARVEYNRPLVLDLSRLMSHAEQVALFSNMEVPVRDVRRLLSDITPELNRHQHKALESMLMPWLNRAAKQRTVTKIQEDGGFSRFWSVMRQRAGMALMFGNTVNTIQQITGFLLAGVKVKTRYMAAASLDFVSNYKEMKQSVVELSEFMRSRMDNEIAAMDDFIQETLINPNLFQKAQNWTNRNAYFLQQAMANSMEPIIWTAAYRQSLDQGMNEADAAFFADGVIRQTQGSTLPEDISRAEGGTAFVRLFTQFMGYFNMQANLLGNGFVKLMRQGGLRQNKLAAAHLFMMGYFLPAAAAELIAAIGYGLKDDDGDGYADEILKTALLDGQVKNGLAMIPGVGQVGTFVYNRFNGKAYGSRLGGAPALSMAEAALLAPWSVAKAVEPDANYRQKRKGVYDTATLISMTLGLPVRGVLKAGEQADDWSGLDMFSEEQN
nr:MAG TPA: crystallin beta/gamma motif-containing protein [Caudoviricetes sp.]